VLLSSLHHFPPPAGSGTAPSLNHRREGSIETKTGAPC
jgi:hypothetical protein